MNEEDLFGKAVGTFEGEKLMFGKVIWTDGITKARCPECGNYLRMRRLEILCRLYCVKCGWTKRTWLNSHNPEDDNDGELKPCCLKEVNGKLIRTVGSCSECWDFGC